VPQRMLQAVSRQFLRGLTTVLLGTVVWLFTAPDVLPHAPAATGEAYFRFGTPPLPETFIFKTTDPAVIQEAREMLSGARPHRRVAGTIVKEPAPYNPPWSYHLDPASIVLFEAAIEVCDASIRDIEEHLDEVCGVFLPGCRWCPWRSLLLDEVSPPAAPAIHLPITAR
jgi:hypothetical protein